MFDILRVIRVERADTGAPDSILCLITFLEEKNNNSVNKAMKATHFLLMIFCKMAGGLKAGNRARAQGDKARFPNFSSAHFGRGWKKVWANGMINGETGNGRSKRLLVAFYVPIENVQCRCVNRAIAHFASFTESARMFRAEQTSRSLRKGVHDPNVAGQESDVPPGCKELDLDASD